MLPQMPLCRRPFERTGTVTIVSELDAIPPVRSSDERGVLVVLSARAIGSLGFGLSVLAIWLRWLSPVVVVADGSPPEVMKIRNRRRRSSKPGASNEHRVFSHSKIIHVERPSTPPKRAYTERRHRVCFADLPHLESEEAPEVQPPHSCISTPALPTFTRSPSTLPSLVLEDTTGRELEGFHPTIHLLPKTKTTFRINSKRSSLPSIPIEEPSSPLMTVTTAATTEMPKNKLARSLTQSWRHSRSKSIISSDTETNTSDTSVLGTCRSPFSKSSNPGYRSSSPSNTSRRSLGSTFFSRRTSTRSSNSPLPRTSPYEAPYFACPPIPFDNAHVRSQSARLPSDYARSTPSGSVEVRRADRDRTRTS